MALLVWFTMGIALWHFTVFLPERFWQGIVGAFLGATIGAVVFGAIVEIDQRQRARQHRHGTALTAIPGVAIGLAVVWRRHPRRAHRELTISRLRPCSSRYSSGEFPVRGAVHSLLAWWRPCTRLQSRAVLLRGGAGALG